MQLKKELKTGRNTPCPCKSGKKYKKCCLKKEQEQIYQQNEARRLAENANKQKRIESENEEKEVIQSSIEESESTKRGNNE